MSANVCLPMSHFCVKPPMLPQGLEVRSTLLLEDTLASPDTAHITAQTLPHWSSLLSSLHGPLLTHAVPSPPKYPSLLLCLVFITLQDCSDVISFQEPFPKPLVSVSTMIQNHQLLGSPTRLEALESWEQFPFIRAHGSLPGI